MRQYHHVKCMFETFVRARPTTKIITEPDDIRGFDDLEESDQQSISETIDGWSSFSIYFVAVSSFSSILISVSRLNLRASPQFST